MEKISGRKRANRRKLFGFPQRKRYFIINIDFTGGKNRLATLAGRAPLYVCQSPKNPQPKPRLLFQEGWMESVRTDKSKVANYPV